MNKQTFKGQWNQLKGDIKTKWGELTKDEVDQVDGNIDKLTGILQEKYGYYKERAEQEIAEFINEYTDEFNNKNK